MLCRRQTRIFRDWPRLEVSRFVAFVHATLRRASGRIACALAQLNDVLTVYAVGLALLDCVVYWRSCLPLR
jgi:hypothetical protein